MWENAIRISWSGTISRHVKTVKLTRKDLYGVLVDYEMGETAPKFKIGNAVLLVRGYERC